MADESETHTMQAGSLLAANLLRVKAALQRQKISAVRLQGPSQVDLQGLLTGCAVLQEVLTEIRPSVVFDFGSWKGSSAVAFSRHLRTLRINHCVVCVDTWLGDVEHHLRPELHAELQNAYGRPTLWEHFVANVQQAGCGDDIYALHATTSIAHDLLIALQCRADLVYVDAGKRYKDVYEDIGSAHDLLNEGGLVFGDNFRHPPVRHAVMQYSQEQSYWVASRGMKWILLPGKVQTNLFSDWAKIAPFRLRRQQGGFGDESLQEVGRVDAPKKVVAPENRITPVYPGQKPSRLRNMIDGMALPEILTLEYCRIPDGYFLIKPGCDGVVFNQNGTPIGSTTGFVEPAMLPSPNTVNTQAGRLDARVFVCVDSLWTNYYHWIVLAVSKMLMASSSKVFAQQPKIAIPDYDAAERSGQKPGFSRAVWLQSLSIVTGQAKILTLPAGIYQSPEVCFFSMNCPQQAALTLFSELRQVWEKARERIRINPELPKKICVLRRDFMRISENETRDLRDISERHGYACGFLEDLNFVQQAELFANAEVIVAPHGAGLSNLLFAKKGRKVLELNRTLPGDSGLRPWFYLLAVQQGLEYSFLDLSAGDFTRERLELFFSASR